jgi:DNA-binding CsgD family transcriptional regulator
MKPVNQYPKDEHGLTARQREVMSFAAKGFNSREISVKLGVSYHTVVTSIGLIYKTLGIGSRAELALEAQRLGVIL